MKLSGEQLVFIQTEFDLTLDDLAAMGAGEVLEFREKCFDIEVEEAAKADNNASGMSSRGDTAAELVDVILDHIKSLKLVEGHYCPLMGDQISPSHCYDINSVAFSLFKPSLIGNVTDREKAEPVCGNCPNKQM